MGWPWAAFPWHLPGLKGRALLLCGHSNYSTNISCSPWVPRPCVCLISFRIKHISSLMGERMFEDVARAQLHHSKPESEQGILEVSHFKRIG